MAERLLRLAALLDKVSLSRSQVYRRVAEGTFPRPVRMGPSSVAWLESEVDAWIATLPRSGDCDGDQRDAA